MARPRSRDTARVGRRAAKGLVRVALLACLAVGIAGATVPATPVITTIVGTGTATGSGDGGAASAASLVNPVAIAIDPVGNMFIVDGAYVRKVDAQGVITTIAGDGTDAFNGDEISALGAGIAPSAIALDGAGNVLIADTSNHRIRKVRPDGTITTVAGNGTTTASGDGGSALQAGLQGPSAVAVDAAGKIYLVDQYGPGTRHIRMVAANGVITSIPNTDNVSYLAVDGSGVLYYASRDERAIYRLPPGGTPQLIAGRGAFRSDPVATSVALWEPSGIAIDANGDVYFSEYENLVGMVTPQGMLTAVAGRVDVSDVTYWWGGIGGFGGDGGPATQALLSGPQAIAVDPAGNVYVADTANHRIRKVTPMGALAVPPSVNAFAAPRFLVTSNGTPFDGQSNPAQTAIADVNNDGRNDLVVLNTYNGDPRDDSILIYLQNANGTLPSVPLQYPFGFSARAGLAIADLNHDEIPDIAVAQDNGLTILWWSSIAANFIKTDFAAPSGYGGADSAVILDVDRDGNPDVVTAGYDRLDVFYGNGAGYIAKAGSFATTFEGPSQLRTGDFNGDGLADIAQLSTQGLEGVQVILHAAGAGFLAPKALPPVQVDPSGLAVGDFNADGRDDLTFGVRVGAPDAAYDLYLQDAQGRLVGSAKATYDFPQGIAATDLDGDDRDDLLILHGNHENSSLGTYFQRGNDYGAEVKTLLSPAWHSGPFAIAVGDLNHDRCKDAVVTQFDPTTSSDIAFLQGRCTPAPAVVLDFNGDGRSDLLWHNVPGDNSLWRSGNDLAHLPISNLSDPNWIVVGAGDFNRDGTADILWRNQKTGADVYWPSADATRVVGVSAVTNLSWKVVGVADFNGDRRSDILWRNASTGANTIWLSGNSATQQTMPTVSVSWAVVGTGDVNGDGKADIAWRNPYTGGDAIWLSGQSSTQQATPAVTATSWSIVGVADFNGDAMADLLWHDNATGKNTIWLSGKATTQRAVATTSAGWVVIGTADYDGDRRADILWRYPKTGANVIWFAGRANVTQSLATQGDGWTAAR